jgi:serine/threonine-protein kinase
VPLAPGDVFAGYTVLRQLGAGGMGAVYLVRHPRLPRLEALKLLRPERSADPTFVARFQHEADVVARLSHRNIVSVHDRGEDAGQLWLTMQFIDGVDVERVLAESTGGLPTPRALHIVAETAAALDCAHRNNLIHRDVKPANILLAASADGDNGPEQVFLTDFGIAKALDGATKLTRTGSILASFDYAPPEQIDGGTVDARSDVYALGCVLYRLLTGSVPFPGATVASLMHSHLALPPPRPTALAPWLPPAIDAVVARAMAKDPAERYRTCRALAEDADRALTPPAEPSTVPLAGSADRVQTDRLVGRPPPLPPPPVPFPPAPSRRNTARWALAAAAVAVVTAAAVTLWLLNRDSGEPDSSSGASSSSTASVPALPAATALAGSTLVAPRTADGNTDLFLVDVGSGETIGRVTTAPGQDVAPLLSPDRRTIAYLQLTAGGSGVLRVVASDGTGDRPMFGTPPAGCDSVLRPAWNPVDPDQLAVVCIDQAGTFRLRILRTDGTVVRDLDAGHTRFDDVSYSPDGSTLVYWASDGSGGAGLFTLAADVGGQPVQLTAGGATDDADAVWSPDGAQIAFRRVAGNAADIYLMNRDGGDVRPLTVAPGLDQDPTWSPDGTRIAFKSDRPGPSERTGNHVWVVSADGTGAAQLPPGDEGADDSAPAWGPR